MNWEVPCNIFIRERGMNISPYDKAAMFFNLFNGFQFAFCFHIECSPKSECCFYAVSFHVTLVLVNGSNALPLLPAWLLHPNHPLMPFVHGLLLRIYIRCRAVGFILAVKLFLRLSCYPCNIACRIVGAVAVGLVPYLPEPGPLEAFSM